MTYIIHEGVTMIGYLDPRFSSWGTYETIPGIVIEQPSREEAGMGVEPSGYNFMNYCDTTTFTFHPYNGKTPVPCTRPNGRMTRRLP